MRVRFITTCALGLAAALSIASTLAAQQDTTKLRKPSETRISISKGEVAPARVDTVFVTRYDTVTVNNSIVRVDTVTVATLPGRLAKLKSDPWAEMPKLRQTISAKVRKAVGI